MKNLYLIVLIFLLLSSVLTAQNNALDFDGSNDYVEVPADASLNMGEAVLPLSSG